MAAGNGYGYTPDQTFPDGLAALKAASTSIQDTLTSLENTANTTLATWTGSAKSQYEVHKKEWDASIAKMHAILGDQAAPALNKISQRYEDMESQGVKKWAY